MRETPIGAIAGATFWFTLRSINSKGP